MNKLKIILSSIAFLSALLAVQAQESTVVIDATTGRLANGNQASSSWTATSEPVLTLTTSGANIRTAGDNIAMHTGGSRATYTITAPSDYYILGYTFTGRGAPGIQSVTVTPHEGASAATFDNIGAKTITATLATPAQSTYFNFSPVGFNVWATLVIYYTDANGENPQSLNVDLQHGRVYTRSGDSVTSTSGYGGYWMATNAPQFRLSALNSNSSIFHNMMINSDGVRIGMHSNNNPNYTITAPDGYLITGYSITGQLEGGNTSGTPTLTPSGGAGTTFSYSAESSASATLSIPGSTAQFTVSGGALGLAGKISVRLQKRSFAHYIGEGIKLRRAAGLNVREFMPNGMGDIDEVHYYYYVDANTSDYGVTASNANGSFNVGPSTGSFNAGSGMSSIWTHSTADNGDPAVTLTTQDNNANMQAVGDDFAIYTGSAGSCVYTLTAPAGLAAADKITGFTITGRALPITNATQTLTMPATTGRFTSNEPRDFSATLSQPSRTATFTYRSDAAKENGYGLWTGIEVHYTDADGGNPATYVISSASSTFPDDNNGNSGNRTCQANGDFAVTLSGNNGNSSVNSNRSAVWLTRRNNDHANDASVVRLVTRGGNGSYTVSVPEGYLITGLSFRNTQNVLGNGGENTCSIVVQNELTTASFTSSDESSVTKAVGMPAQTAQFTLAANGSSFDGQVAISYVDADGTAGTATLNATNGAVDGTGTTFTSTAATPQFTITSSVAGHVAADGNNLRLTSVGEACTFTLGVADGYRIVGYTLTGKAAILGHTSQAVATNGQTQNFAEGTDATITVSGLTGNTAQFTLGGANTGLLITGMTVSYESSPNATYGGKRLINLDLPLLNYAGAGNGNYEPIGYFRWFDYRTDQRSERLLKYNDSENQLQPMHYADGRDCGLVAYNINGNPRRASVGIYYAVPQEAGNASWAGDVVACDVSRYADYNDLVDANGNHVYAPGYFVHEPTLSTRYVFHILPARQLADSLRAALLADHSRGADMTLDDKKSIAFGAKDFNSRMTLRTALRYVNSYWFYPVSNPNTHHVYHPEDDSRHAIVEADVASTSLLRASQVEWRVYSEDQKYWRTFATGASSMPQISINMLYNNGNDWNDLDGNPVGRSVIPQIIQGTTLYIVGLLKNGSYSAPFYNVALLLQHIYPRTQAQQTNPMRTKSYLEARYRKIVDASFDGSFNDFKAPTNVIDNMQPFPDDFRLRQYGFVYPSLAFMNPWRDHGRAGDYFRYGPQHGDYGLYKTANVEGISKSVASQTGYIFSYDNRELYDRTHEQDNNRYGQFLYVDASDEARQIGSYDVSNQTLCSGSRIFISAWVASMTSPTATQPEVRFNLYGVRKDADGFDVQTKLLGGIASGDFLTNADSYDRNSSQGMWYQVFGTFLLTSQSGAENFTDFRVTIDNYCGNTNGADYAIDDIQVYASNAKVTLTQSPPVCPSDGDVDTPTDVTYTVFADYNTLQDFTAEQGAADRKVFYRFVTADGDVHTPATGIDYDGDGTADAYGVAVVPAFHDESRQLAAGVPMFVDNEYGLNIVLAEQMFPLSRSKTYFVSLALPSSADASKPGVWGDPTSPCSFYSRDFNVVEQKLATTDSMGRSTSTVYADCGSTWATLYSLKTQLRVPSRMTSGEMTLDLVPFDWYVVDNGAAAGGTQELTQDLIDALKRFRQAYPTATDLSGEPAGDYSSADKAMLTSDLYNYNGSGGPEGSPTGHLLLTASPSFVGDGSDNTYHMRIGSHTIYAIPTTDTFVSPTDGITYELCGEPMKFTLNVLLSGPELSFGIDGVIYPEDLEERAVRTGFPQIRAMQAAGAPLRLPVNGRMYAHASTPEEELTFVGSTGRTTDADAQQVFLVPYDEAGGPYSTTDPTIGPDVKIGTVAKATFLSTDSTISLLFAPNALSILHEGYQYALQLRFVRTDSPEGVDINHDCVGESYLLLKIVPEHLTWNPQTTEATNWNIDANWRRSTAAELYKADYTDYGEATYPTAAPANAAVAALSPQQAYVPMDFTKVTIPALARRPYPMLPYIQYNSVGTAVEMSNDNGSFATEYIEYDMQAYSTADKAAAAGTYDCRNFQGNVCDEIYFKPQAELMRQNYLAYRRAWVEKELVVGQWNTLTSPLKCAVSGDYYVPKANGRQETEAFQPITYAAAQYSRVRYPFYQRMWGANIGQQVNPDGSTADAYDHPDAMLVYPDETPTGDLVSGNTNLSHVNAWSHVFNKPDFTTQSGEGISLRVGDDEFLKKFPEAADASVLLRLPKADKTYSYYDAASGAASAVVNAPIAMRQDAATDPSYRLGVDYDAGISALARIDFTPDAVSPAENHYYLVGNPYMSSISVQQFLTQNSSALEDNTKVWVLRDGVLYELPATNSGQVSSSTDVIRPFEAFFVKMSEPRALVFSNVMQAAANVRTGTLAQAAAAPVFVSYSIKSRSVAVSVERVEGSVRVYSPSAGCVAVDNMLSSDISRIYVYSSDGVAWAQSGRCPSGGSVQLKAPRGVVLVRLLMADGTTDVRKLVVS